jgi:Coenzyme PQQ synthesis protein D (PqqD)
MGKQFQSTPPSPETRQPVDPTMVNRTIAQPNSDVQGTSIENETVLLDLSTGRYYTLNRLGSVVWEHCTADRTIGDIHAILCQRFDVTPERALEDLVALINDLVQEGLLKIERR